MLPRGFGVLAFDSSRPLDGVWQGFSTQRFVLPKCLVRWKEGTATVLATADSHTDLTPAIRRVTAVIQRPITPLTDLGEPEGMSLPLTRDAWRHAVARIQERIHLGHLQKVVLSRQVVLRFSQALDAAAVLARLAEDAQDSTVFALRQRAGVFLGATPERLFALRRDQLAVDSMAGTRPRGQSAEDDRRYADELTHSEKERFEQQLVTEHLVQQMQSICDEVVIEPAPRVRRLKTVQHLATVIVGTVRDGVALDQVLDTLHPTPATCGEPILPARDMLAELEPESRGLYAGTIGWVDTESAEFVVTIRSGLLQQNEARLFAGAGIVAGSDADQEYEECEWKMLPVRQALTQP